MNTPGSIPGFLFYPHVGQVTDRRAVQRHRAPATRRAARKIFSCAPPRQGSGAAGRGDRDACARRIVSTLAKRAFRRPVTAADMKHADGVLPGRARRGRHVRRRHRGRAAAHPGGSGVHLSRRARAGDARSRASLPRSATSRWRRGSSFFLWSSIPGRSADRPRGAGPAAGAGGARAAGPAHAGGSEVRTRWSRNFTGQWLSVRSLATSEPVVNLFPDFDDNLRAAYPARDRAVLRQRRPGGSQRARSARRQLHVRQRAAGQALRHPERLRSAVPPRDAAGGARHAARPARQGRADDGDVERRPAPRRSRAASGSCRRSSASRRRDPPPDVPALAGAARTDTTGNTKPPTMRQALEAHRAQPDLRVVPSDLRADGRWRWRTSTPSAPGGRWTRAADRRLAACCPTARR